MTLEEAVASISRQAEGIEEADTDALALLTRVALAFPEMLKALEAREWSGDEMLRQGIYVRTCPECEEAQGFPHSVICGLGEALRAAREAVKP